MYRLGIPIGSAAPVIKAADVSGDIFDSTSFKGRSGIIVFFYRSYTCATCRAQLKELARHRDTGFIIVAISTERPDTGINLMKELKMRVISDSDRKIIRDYGVYDTNNDMAFISVFIVGKDGKIKYRRYIEGIDNILGADELSKYYVP